MKAEPIRDDNQDARKATVAEVRAAYRAFGLPVPVDADTPYPASGQRRHIFDPDALDQCVRVMFAAQAQAGATTYVGNLLYAWAVLWHYELQPDWNPMSMGEQREAANRACKTMRERIEAYRATNGGAP